MLRTITIIITFALSINTFAQSESSMSEVEAKYEAQRKQIRSEWTNLQSAIDNINNGSSGLIRMREKLAQDKKELENLKKRASTIDRTVVTESEQRYAIGALETMKTTVDQLNKDIAAAEKSLAPNVARIAELRAKLTELDTNKKTAATTVSEKIAALNAKIEQGHLEDKASTITRELNQVQDGYERLQNKYDNTVLKIYLYSKFNKLLNSPAFCQAKSRCDNGAKNPYPFDLRDVFTNKVFQDGGSASGSASK